MAPPPAEGSQRRSGYGRDIAYAHQTGHSDFAREAAPGILDHLRAAGIHSGRVLDLGCGTGVLARELSQAGYEVVGVDLSPHMVELARQAVPEATFLCGSFFEVELPPCVAVVAVGQSFGYAFDPRNSAAELTRLLGRIWQALRPGGLLLFDLDAPGEDREEEQCGPRWDRHDMPDWTLVVRTVRDERRPTLTRNITLFRRIGDLYRRTDECHVVLLHEPEAVLVQLASTGYVAHRLDGYGNSLRFPPTLAAYHAVRPAARPG